MGIAFFLREYISWHYGKAFSEMQALQKDFLWFFYHFFSIPSLAKTLIAPFRRIQEKGGRSMELLLQNIVANTISRLVGFALRSIVIGIGLLIEFFVFIAILPALFIWLLLPIDILGVILIPLLLLFV